MKKHSMEQRSDEWLHMRKGKISGTVLKDIMGTPKKRQDAFYEILAERLTVGVDSENDDYESPMDRGTRLEPDAISLFEFETGKTVEIVGLLQDDENENIMQSPDGLIGEDEAIEVKCMGGKNHIKFWLTNEVPDEYEWQVVQYFVVNEKLKTLYFVGYNPDIPSRRIHILEVKREEVEDKIVQAREAQNKFLKEVEDKLKEIIEL